MSQPHRGYSITNENGRHVARSTDGDDIAIHSVYLPRAGRRRRILERAQQYPIAQRPRSIGHRSHVRAALAERMDCSSHQPHRSGCRLCSRRLLMHSTEGQIWRLLPALEKLTGDDDARAVAFARAAADSLRQLVGTGVFGTLAGPSFALMQTIAEDQNMRPADGTVAKALLAALDSELGYSKLSNTEISVRSGLSSSKVRTSLKRLIAAGYFRSIAPSPEEWRDSDHVLKYEPQFDCLAGIPD